MKPQSILRSISIFALSSSLFLLAACQSSEEENSFSGSSSTPKVESVSPVESATDVGLDSYITVTFDQAMTAYTLTSNYKDTTCFGHIQLSSDDFVSCIKMSGDPADSNNSKTFTVKPAADLTASTQYKIKVEGNNNSLTPTYLSTAGFTTGTQKLSILKSLSPTANATDQPLSTPIQVVFSRDIDASSVNVSTFTVNGITGTVSYDTSSKTATFTPSSKLSESTTYTATLTTGITEAGVPAFAANYNWSFTTGKVWETRASMPTLGSDLTSSVVNGEIYVLGYSISDNSTSLKVYDPNTDTWSTKTSMPTFRASFSSSVVNGKIYVFGGRYSYSVFANTVEAYDPVANTWSTKASMSVGRSSFSSSVVNGKTYVFGGYDSVSSLLSTVEMYDPSLNSWTVKASIPMARSDLTSSVIDGKIYVIGGGDSNSDSTSVEMYDPTTDAWTTKTSMPTARDSLTSSVVERKVYVIGGTVSAVNFLNTVERYDSATDTWETMTSMPTARNQLTSNVIGGKIYVIGGNDGNVDLNTVEVYNPAME